MYDYVTDKDFLRFIKRECADIVNRLVQRINNEGIMKVRAFPVGSGANNLITRNGKGPVDLDYNLELLNDAFFPDGRTLKDYIKDRLDAVLQEKGWKNAQDSKAVLTARKTVLWQREQIPFHMDIAIVRERWWGWERLIHEKNGRVDVDRWYWNQAPQLKGLEQRVKWLKAHGLWNEVRERYLERKNDYLVANDHRHPSFVVYIEVVNEIYHANQPQQISCGFVVWDR